MTGPKLATMAWRNLWRQRRRTILTLISIGFGFFLAVMFTAMQDESFADMIDRAARGGTGHVTIQHRDYLDTPKLTLTVADGDALSDVALGDADVAAVVQRITGQAVVSTARDSFGAFVIAYDPASETADTFEISRQIVSGEPFQTGEDEGIILGETLAHNLQAEPGDRVVYRMVDRSGEVVGALAKLRGTLRTGAPSADAGLVLLPIDTLRKVLGYGPTESTQLAVFLNDARAAPDVAERLDVKVGSDVSALTWEEVRPELSAFVAMKVGGARFMELIIMLLVAAGIFNTLFVSVMERLREFGIMMAIGYSPGQLFKLVMWESAWLALIGLVVGAALVALPYYYLATHGVDLSSVMGETTEIAGVGFEPILKVGIFPESLAIIVMAVVVATLSAGLYPAWRAARVAPAESIKLV